MSGFLKGSHLVRVQTPLKAEGRSNLQNIELGPSQLPFAIKLEEGYGSETSKE